MRNWALHGEFVEFIPDELIEGRLYISRRYRTASHLCCCGCGAEIVTPLNPAKWYLTEHPDGTVSLIPSIGNWSLPCKSHYFVSRNRIQWAGAFTPAQIAAVRSHDQYDVVALDESGRSTWIKFGDAVRRAWKDMIVLLAKAWRG